jgi:lysophospholipid acyltransferase (LPLAT)-like uncharacterized protein
MSELRYEAAGVLGAGIGGALFLTTRVSRAGTEHFEKFRIRGEPVIFVFWHGHLLPLVHYHRGEGIVVLVSEHADGEYITRVIERNGFGTVRGSSTRGGTTGLRGLVRAARSGKDLALTPDGPGGPPGEFKPSALLVAQLTGLPIIPLGVGASRGRRLRSWDAFLVPAPWSHVAIEYLPPRYVPREATRSDLERMATAIGVELNALEERLSTGPSGLEGGG